MTRFVHLVAAVIAANNFAITPAAAKPTPREQALARQLTRERAAWAHERSGLRARAESARRTALHTPSVSEALTIASIAYGVPRGELASVAWCESTHRPWARNGQSRGLFQEGPMFEAGPFGRAGLSVWSPYAAAMTAAYTVRREGWSQWQCRPGGGLAW